MITIECDGFFVNNEMIDKAKATAQHWLSHDLKSQEDFRVGWILHAVSWALVLHDEGGFLLSVLFNQHIMGFTKGEKDIHHTVMVHFKPVSAGGEKR